MREEAAEDRVSGRLRSVRRNKWTIFFMAATAVFLVPHFVQAGQETGSVTVSATVAQTAEFSRALAKNSSVSIMPSTSGSDRWQGTIRLRYAPEKPYGGQEVEVSVLAGGVRIVSVRSAVGQDGTGTFEIVLPEGAGGMMSVSVAVISLPVAIALHFVPVTVASDQNEGEKPGRKKDTSASEKEEMIFLGAGSALSGEWEENATEPDFHLPASAGFGRDDTMEALPEATARADPLR